MNLLFKLNLQLFAEDESEKDSKEELTIADAYNKLKNESVSKEEYDNLKKEYSEVVEKIINGDNEDDEETEGDERTVEELRKSLFSEDSQLTNLEFAENALKLRKKLIEEGERDPFLAYGSKIYPEESDIAEANKVAEALQYCIDVAEGNPEVFQRELQRIIVDVSLPKRKR